MHLCRHGGTILRGVSHLVDGLLHLLFGECFGCTARLFGHLGNDLGNYLVMEGGCVCLIVEAEGIRRDGWLTLFGLFLRPLEVGFECCPNFFGRWSGMPLPDVAGKDG